MSHTVHLAWQLLCHNTGPSFAWYDEQKVAVRRVAQQYPSADLSLAYLREFAEVTRRCICESGSAESPTVAEVWRNSCWGNFCDQLRNGTCYSCIGTGRDLLTDLGLGYDTSGLGDLEDDTYT